MTITTYLVSWTESAPLELRRRLTPAWMRNFDAHSPPCEAPAFDGELDALLAATPEFEHDPCWPLLAGALESLRARVRAAGHDPAAVLECEEWRDTTSIADALALAFGFPARAGFSYAADADHVALEFADGTLDVRHGCSGHGVGDVTVRGFQLERTDYVGLLLRVGTPRVLAITARDAAMLVAIMAAGVDRDARESVDLISELASRAFDGLSARLDRRKSGVDDPAAARMRKLGDALGLQAAIPCRSLVSLIRVHPDQPCTLGLARSSS